AAGAYLIRLASRSQDSGGRNSRREPGLHLILSWGDEGCYFRLGETENSQIRRPTPSGPNHSSFLGSLASRSSSFQSGFTSCFSTPSPDRKLSVAISRRKSDFPAF